MGDSGFNFTFNTNSKPTGGTVFRKRQKDGETKQSETKKLYKAVRPDGAKNPSEIKKLAKARKAGQPLNEGKQTGDGLFTAKSPKQKGAGQANNKQTHNQQTHKQQTHNQQKFDKQSTLTNQTKFHKQTNFDNQNKFDKQTRFEKQTKEPFKKHFPKDTNSDEQLSAIPRRDFTESNDKEDGSHSFVKRKKRKDKQLMKKLVQEGKGEEVQAPVNNSQVSYSLFGEKHKQFYVDVRAGVSVSEKVFSTAGKKFSDLNIHKYLVSNLEKIGFTTLTTVQDKSIPVTLTGQNTLIRSQTGSGKTLAYAVPIIDALQGLTPKLKRTDGVQAIVVVPTRELAMQTHELFSKINTFQCINVGHLCGGENRKSEKDRIRKGINVLIATPGRLLDHVLHTDALKVDKVRCLVLDEADRLLDMGFRKDIISLVEHLDRSKTYSEYDPMAFLKSGQPKRKEFDEDQEEEEQIEQEDSTSEIAPLKDPNSKKRQTILLSATLTKAVSELADFTMKEHVYIDALDAHASNVIAESYVIPSTVKQEFILTYVKHRLFTLSALIVAQSKLNSKMFIFMASGQMVEYHYDLFTRCLARLPKNRGKLKVGEVALLEEDSDDSEDEEEDVLDTQFFMLHGSMDQKIRKEVFNGFRAAKKGVLLCTDVAARGIDVPEADCIVQYTGPQSDEDYLHRVGRTGRAGKSGSAYIFLTHEEQEYISRLRDHKVFLKKKDPEVFLEELCDLMEEPDHERAATALQKRYESAVTNDRALHTAACFAYSSWSRFYNAYSAKLRAIFDFKKLNQGHYVTSFALRDTPSQVAKVVRGQVANVEKPRLNKKLANHAIEETTKTKQPQQPKKRKSLSLMTSEFASGLEPLKKKKKKNTD